MSNLSVIHSENVDNYVSEVLVSVIIATYRREVELKRALKSLIQQTHKNIEIIVVDDNAEDMWNKKVKDIIDVICIYQPIIYIVNETNNGSAETRNIGIRRATGSYITFLDDDDVYLPEKIKKQVACIHDADADLCITDLYLYDENNVQTDKRIRNYIQKTDQRSLLTYHLKYHLTGTDVLMFRKSFLQKIGGFPQIDVGDEFYLVLRAIENGAKFAYLPRCDVKAYVHSKNGGLSTGQAKIEGEKALYRKKKEYFSNLSKSDIRYINMRHYAVLSIANKTTKKYFSFLKYALTSFFNSPTGFISLYVAHKGR